MSAGALVGWRRYPDGTLETAGNLSRRSGDDRLALADPFVGERVEVTYSYLRREDNAERIIGRLVTLARVAGGGGEVLVLEVPGLGRARAFKLATVIRIRQMSEESSHD